MLKTPNRSHDFELGAVLDRAPSIVSVKDLQGRFFYINRPFEDQFKIDRADFLGQRVQDFLPEELADEFRANDAAALASADAIESEQTVPTPDGERVFFSRKFALRDDQGIPYAIAAISTDITARKLVEALAAEAGERATAARDEADRANLAKSEFLSAMSHELRTPLNAILGFAQLLEMDHLSKGQREGVDQILSGGHHLLTLIGEVLDLAQIEAGRMSTSLESVHVGQSLQEVLALSQPAAAKRNVTLTDISGPAEVFVQADRQRFKQVLLNLVSNAIKYNREGGRVDVGSEGRDGRIRLLVADTGPGVPEALLDTIFSPFERLKADRNGIEGSGLGLALSRGLVEVMGGSIGAESTLGEGSVFWMEFPSATDNDPASIDASWLEKDPVAGPRTILYIEDNQSNLKLVQGIFQHLPDMTLLTARQGADGVDLAREHRPDLILLDLHLPDMTGEEALRRLSADSVTARIPVIVVSADASAAASDRLLSFGAQAFLTKPLDIEEFLSVVRGHLSARSSSG